MKRRNLCPFLLSLFLSLGTLFPTQQPTVWAATDNLLLNGGFEEGAFMPTGAPTGWSKVQYNPGRAQFAWDKSQAHGGSKSVKISADQLDDARWLQTVTVQPNAYYELSGWLRTTNVQGENGGGGAHLSVETNDIPFLARTPKQRGTSDWHYVRTLFANGSATQVTIGARLGDYADVSMGVAWFDDLALRQLTTLDFRVTPVLFRPNDVPPMTHALPWIDTQMQMVQHWYGEQLRNRTFTLEAAREVVGTYPLMHYYGDCVPPREGCTPPAGEQLFSHVFPDLATLGYPDELDRVVVAFFQSDGERGVALGGPRQALVALPPDDLLGDSTHIGSHLRVDQGGFAHELGHSFGLPHTLDDPEGSPGLSLMNYGFYNFPQITLVNTATNPERNQLRAGGFFSNTLPLTDGGFEDCLAAWQVTQGTPTCAGNGQQHSGLSALQFTAANQHYALQQEAAVTGATAYAFSGWVKIDGPASDFTVQVIVQALSSGKNVLNTFTVSTFNSPTRGWVKVGTALPLPAEAASVRVKVSAQGKALAVWLDDLYLQPATAALPAPLPMVDNDGQAVADLHPMIQWTEVVRASTYTVQLATNPEFTPLLAESQVTAPFLTADLPAFDTYYFWRVKAHNGSGESAWSPVWSLVARPPVRFYDDEFSSGVLDTAWAWQTTAPAGWSFSSPPNRQGGYLAIPMPLLDLDVTGSPRRLLLRATPPGDFEAHILSEVWKFGDNPSWAGIQESRGLLLYQDDDNYLRLGQRYADSNQLEVVAKVNGAVVTQAQSLQALAIPLKVVRKGNTYRGYYSVDGIHWRQLGQTVTAAWSTLRMGLFAYHTTADNTPSVAYFNRFRVTTPCYSVVTTVAEINRGTVQQSAETCAAGGYRGGAPVTLSATPAVGYHFGYWQGSVSSQSNPLLLSVSGDLNVSAVFYRYGVESMANIAQAGAPGTSVIYALPIRNTGTITDAYTLAVSTNRWPTSAPAVVGPIAAGAILTAPVTVQIPTQALAFATDVATLQLTSQGDAQQGTVSTLTTTATPVSAVSVTVAVSGQAGAPAATVVYPLVVTNAGNITDTFTLAFRDNQWPTTLPTTVGPLAPGASVTLSVVVTIPAGATAAANDTVVVTVATQRDPTKSATISVTTTAQVEPVPTYRIFLPVLAGG